jgi:pimeloyl-ACP methyl ester carboxylesterase
MTTAITGGHAHLGDIDVAYSEAGTGASPVVLIHGLAEDRHSWRHQQRDLVEAHTFAYDLRGHGGTTLGAPEGTLAQLGGDLVALLEHVTGPATLVGFSLGGTVALLTAAERPDLVVGVVVLGTSSVVGRAAAEFYADRIDKAADTASPEFRAAMHDDTVAAVVGAGESVEDVVAARLAAVGDGRGYINAARAMVGLRENPLTPRLAEVTAHVDVVAATDDAFCPAKASRIVVDALPDATYHEIPDAGHLVKIDNPDAVTECLRATLRSGG